MNLAQSLGIAAAGLVMGLSASGAEPARQASAAFAELRSVRPLLDGIHTEAQCGDEQEASCAPERNVEGWMRVAAPDFACAVRL